jgi:tetratricopeptide (TPR) repeat protein
MPLTTSVLQGPTLLSIAALAGLVVAAFTCARRAPLVSLGILWFFLHLLPTNSVLPRYDVLSERNLYLPSIGLHLAVTAATVSLARWVGERHWFDAERGWSERYARGAVRALQLALVVGLVGLTTGRNALYADPVAFWSDAVAKSPQKARPRTNLGRAYIAAGDLDQAMEQFRIALTLDRLDRAAQESLLFTWELATRFDAPRSVLGADPGGR